MASLKAKENFNLFARDSASIDRLINQVREQGYAYNEGHLLPGVSALAFPLIDRLATLVAVLGVVGRHERLNPRDGAETIAYLKDAARGFGH
jgi:DNA-binding IclR family transcriptional regulator